ncbi:DUF2206 domain-containing protein [Halostella sp. JP-L12]|uniref:DUF2206 domain-containing protein n=1 Tax=Halostella TaxID=1843185 RepID=UPI0013CE5770|nr:MULTISPECIES: DUF2206 domain-containing protein [Halostella]NHN46522.1 DUF2206 domain-containing protein [Halostella sp. JP-L12]
MAVGLLAGVLPFIGRERPLAIGPLLVGMLTLLGVLTIGVRYHEAPKSIDLTIPASLDTLPIQPMILLLVPLWSILSVKLLNVTGRNVPLILVLGGLAVLAIAISLSYFDDRYLTLAVWSMALALLYHKSLWEGFVYGGHASVVTFYETEAYALSAENLLPNAVLMPALARLAGIEILTQMKVIMPFLVAFIPAGIYTASRRYTSTRTAFLGAVLFIFAHPFYYQYPSTPRASMPVFFFVLIGLAMSESEFSVFQRRGLAFPFAYGLIVSHYGTSYYVMFAIVGAFVLLISNDVISVGIHRLHQVERRITDGGQPADGAEESNHADSTFERWGGILTPQFVMAYVVAVLGWYLYTGDGTKFELLKQRLVKIYSDLIGETSGHGSTMTRMTVDYGAESIVLSKYLYVLIGFLTGAGLTVVYARHVFDFEDTEFDKGYLALGTLVFVLFGGTVIFSGQWGGGRPMMVVLAFDAVFVVVAVVTMGKLLRSSILRVTEQVGWHPSVVSDLEAVSRRQCTALAVLLAVFLLVNSGVMAAVVLGGYAPSTVPLAGDTTKEDYPSHRVGTFVETDIQAHAWTADHMDRQLQMYSDRVVYQQATDWYNGETAARSTRGPYRFKPKYDLENVADSSSDPGYILLGGHNVVSGIVWETHLEQRPLADYELETEQRNKVYTSGQATLYHSNESHENDTETI